MSSAASTAAAACCAVGAFCWNARLCRKTWLLHATARGALPASCGRESCAVHVERAILLADDAALRHAVRILAVETRPMPRGGQRDLFCELAGSHLLIEPQGNAAVGDQVFVESAVVQ